MTNNFRLAPSPALATDSEISGLFRLMGEPTPARNTDPPTAHVAAGSLNLPQLESLVLQALRLRGARGATSGELADLLGMSLVTVSPRLRPLAVKGLVVASNETRMGPSGRSAIVWKATEHGVDQAKINSNLNFLAASAGPVRQRYECTCGFHGTREELAPPSHIKCPRCAGVAVARRSAEPV